MPPTSKQVNHFCYNIGPEILTFDQATLYAPILLISWLYLPSILYVLILSLKTFGVKKCIEHFFENPVVFVFPIFTSFFFNHDIESTERRRLGNKKKQSELNP